ncbi:hypothetical protein B0H11DRAFT_2218991 [Mycena galericulata]|nr:hypothetical protein B0H11DRAFT_2218991 [Mycena galericulata]
MNISELHYQGFFFGAESVLPTFPNCDTLDIVAGRAMPWIPITLTNFPALKNFNLSVSRFHTFPGFGGPAVIDPPELGGAGVCPLLKVYWGPCQILHLLPISQLLRLSIDACEPDDFRAEMQSISKSNDIRYLDITFSGYLSSFRGLFDIFSDLNVLQVTMLRRLFPEEDDQAARKLAVVYTLLDDLPSSLPQHLVRLAISWKVDEALDMPDIPDLPKQRDDIVAKCPTLETLWVHCANFAYVWSKLPDGTEGAVTGGPDIAAQVLPHFDWLFSNQ